jgi:hypothetical protein
VLLGLCVRSDLAGVTSLVRALGMGGLVEGIAPADRNAFVHEVAVRMPGPRIDYVRLNIRSRRAG